MQNGDEHQADEFEVDGIILGFGVVQNVPCVLVQCAGEREVEGQETTFCGTELALQLPVEVEPPEDDDQAAVELGVPCPSCTEHYGKPTTIPLAMLIGGQVVATLDTLDEDDDDGDGDDGEPEAGGSDAEVA